MSKLPYADWNMKTGASKERARKKKPKVAAKTDSTKSPTKQNLCRCSVRTEGFRESEASIQ